MADQKISALTGATTPLAGTEVLPIVQSSATVKVSVANLTAGRDVSATSIAAGLGAIGTPAYTFTGDLNTGVWSPAADTLAVSAGGVEAMRVTSATNVGFGTTSPSGKVESSVTSSGAIVNALTISNPVPNAVNTGVALFFNPNGAASAARSASIKSVQSSSGNFADLRFFTAPGDEPIERLRITATGDITASTGNIIPATAGKGIDFSANTGAAGMTSELLNWYEEGTWTAVISDGTNNATMSAQTCRYVRIGRHITVNGFVSITSRGSMSGSLRITGLPFTCANANAAYAGGAVTYASNLNIVAGQSVTVLPELNTTYMALYVWAGTAGTSQMQNTQWTDTGSIMFSATYSV